MAAEKCVSVEFREVGKTYESISGKVEAVDEVSLSVQGGEFVSIIGPSGCGKSTLLLMAAGLIKASRGKIFVDGNPVEKPVRNVGFVFQDHLLLEWRTVKKNLLLPVEMGKNTKISDERIDKLIQMVGLSGFENRYPMELSGGMQQRVALCRALITDPNLLLMDEPLGALDALTRQQVRYELEKLWLERTCTTLFVTHDIEESILLADRVVVMSERPSKVMEVVNIDLPRPRVFSKGIEAEFDKYKIHIRNIFERIGVLGSKAHAR